MVNPFETRSQEIKEKKRNPNGSPFSQRAVQEEIPQEPWYQELLRTAIQAPAGFAKRYTFPADLYLALAGAEDEEELERLRMLPNWDEEAYQKGREQALSTFPTQGNISRMIEEETGFPLEPKTKLQKNLNLAGTGAGFGGASGAVAAPAVSEATQALGGTEELGEFLGVGAGALGKKGPQLKAETKPSGLPTRRFESVKSIEKVPGKKISKINETLESDFKNIADKIFEETPIYDVQSALKEGPLYKANAVESFEKVQNLANELPESVSSKEIVSRLKNQVSPKRQKGFMDSESDIAYKKVLDSIIEKSPKEGEGISAGKLVEQYRKNNEELSKLFEPGQSKAYNAGKAEAYLDYNKAIGQTIEDLYPESEFSALFKESNRKWSQIKDAEAIETYMDKVFEGEKVNFKEAKKALESKNLSHSLKRSLGDKGYSDFKQLVNDLSSVEPALKNLREIPGKSLGEYATSFTPFLFNKTFGTVKWAAKELMNAKRSLWEFMLDKPKYRLEWKEGVKALRDGNPQKAKEVFDGLKSKISVNSPELMSPFERLSPKETAVKKFREHKLEKSNFKDEK